MTISTTSIRFEYTGNGATVNFAVGHKFFANSDLKVYQAGTLKTITTHYTVTGAGDEAGGTVTFLVAPTNGQAIIILIDPPITQTMDLVENDPLPAESVEDAFDKVTTVNQRLADRLDRSLVLPDNIEGASVTVPAPSARKAILWNATADGLENSTYDPDLAGTYAANAAASAIAAATAETNAELAETNAETAETNAEAAAVAAAASAATAASLLTGMPTVSKSADYTLVLGDAGYMILHPSADTTPRTWTIPANASVAFAVGTTITFRNQNAAGAITIAITSDTLRAAISGSTGSRTLAANGIATAVKEASTEWVISGAGLS